MSCRAAARLDIRCLENSLRFSRDASSACLICSNPRTWSRQCSIHFPEALQGNSANLALVSAIPAVQEALAKRLGAKKTGRLLTGAIARVHNLSKGHKERCCSCAMHELSCGQSHSKAFETVTDKTEVSGTNSSRCTTCPQGRHAPTPDLTCTLGLIVSTLQSEDLSSLSS